MIYRDSQNYEYINKHKRDNIKDDLFECYKKLCKGENVNKLIRSHKRFIIGMELNGKNKNKYKTVSYLEHYSNTKNKVGAMIVLTNTINGISYLRGRIS